MIAGTQLMVMNVSLKIIIKLVDVKFGTCVSIASVAIIINRILSVFNERRLTTASVG